MMKKPKICQRAGYVVLILMACGVARAGLLGQYFNTIDLQDLATRRVDNTIDFTNWDQAPTDTAVTADNNFSERWTGYVRIDTAGDWTFITVSNDGVRLWVDEDLIIDHWNQHIATEERAVKTLDAGWYPIKLEHFQQNGTVVIQLFFSGPSQPMTIIPDDHTSSTNPGYPKADAGQDQFLVLPANNTVLTGAGTDVNGVIVEYAWEQLVGPSAMMNDTNDPCLILTDLTEGTYEFQLTVTDNDGLMDKDSAMVYVVPEGGEGLVSGELKTWHTVTITFSGPITSEQATPNPFTDYRMQVIFIGPSGQTYEVPGYFAADGNAAETSATGGNQWRVHFVPDEEGLWSYVASLRTGSWVAVDLSADAGASAGYFDGAAGSFLVEPTDKTGNDFRAKGMLRYVNMHYLAFAGTGEYYLKGGADSPENFLGYFEFDGTSDEGGLSPNTPDGLHHYEPHLADWSSGDPTWQDGKGKGIIGALNYLADMGGNSVYFLTYNVDGGDGRDSWIWTSPTERERIDVSKLTQWEIVFSHMDAKGIQLHVVTSEAENHGNLGKGFSDIRKLYYRELISHFAHHLAVIWNIGEENGNSDEQRKQFAAYIHALDPYDHPVTVHTYSGQASTFYDGLLGDPHFEATSIQGNGNQYNSWAIELRQRSAAAGRPWAIYGDEQGPAVNAGMNNLDALRKGALWGNLMGGGAGVEWYWGYQGDFGDCQSEDWRVGEPLWNMTRYALDFFQTYLPFWEMEPANELTPADDYVFIKPGDIYVVYLKNGKTTTINIPAGDEYTIRWYDPRNGGPLLTGTIAYLQGGQAVSIGLAPHSTNQDWVVLICKNQQPQ